MSKDCPIKQMAILLLRSSIVKSFMSSLDVAKNITEAMHHNSESVNHGNVLFARAAH